MKMRCTVCSNDFEMPADRCPHCAEPGLFPNVVSAASPDNLDVLEKRLEAAIRSASSRGSDDVVRAFMKVVEGSKAVIARRLGEVERLARSDKEIYASYYQQRRAQLRQPDGEPWDPLREPADQALFGELKENIRFAALSLDGLGVLNYGDWSIVLRTRMIERRASIFEENTATFMRDRKIPISEMNSSILGYRTSWNARAKLCASKLADAITATTKPTDFPGLLIEQGPPGDMTAPRFVEVHIYGPLTIRTVEAVILKEDRDALKLASPARLAALQEDLMKVNVTLEVRT